jgi:membrane protein implicated in regulation of membrane protease activity
VPSSKYSSKKELLVPQKPFAIDKPKIQEFKFGRKVFKKEKVSSLKEMQSEHEPEKVKLFRKKEQVTLSDTITFDKGYRGRVLLGMSATALLLGGLVSATPFGFAMALLGFSLLIVMLYKREREVKSKLNEYGQNRRFDKYHSKQLGSRLESKPIGEKSRFKLIKIVFIVVSIGLLSILLGLILILGFGLMGYAAISLLIIGLILLLLSPGLVVISHFGQRYTEQLREFKFYNISILIASLGMLALAIAIWATLPYSAVFIIVALLLALLLWALVRSTLKSRKQLRSKE